MILEKKIIYNILTIVKIKYLLYLKANHTLIFKGISKQNNIFSVKPYD